MSDTVTDLFLRVAEVYDDVFVPALIGPFAKHVVDGAHLEAGDHVVDVACGTGVVALEAHRRIGRTGRVTGVDPNEGMLARARAKGPDIDWRTGTGEALPFPDASQDAVLSQFGLMFFDDRTQGLREMWRILKPQGRLSVAVWAGLDHAPVYAEAGRILHRLVGEEAGEANNAPFSMGDKRQLQALFREAGIARHTLQTIHETTRFPSLERWVETDLRLFAAGDTMDDDTQAQVLEACEDVFAQYIHDDGTFCFPVAAHVVTAKKS